MKSATATLKGFEIMRTIRRGHRLTCKRGANNEVRFVNSLFDRRVIANVDTEALSVYGKSMQQSFGAGWVWLNYVGAFKK